jgi:hypothetical protein
VSNRSNQDNFGLLELLDAMSRKTMLELNCHAIGIIQSFDPARQVADVHIAYLRTFEDTSTDSGERHIPYNVLLDCPCVILRGGKMSVRPPIQAGDECLILFNDRDIDSWFAKSQVGILKTERTHDFTDAIALVGLGSTKNFISAYDPSALEIGSQQQKLRVSDAEGASIQAGAVKVRAGLTKVKVENAVFNLGALVQELLVINQSLVAAIVNTTGIDSTAKAALIAQYTALAAKYGALLE